MNTAIIVAAGSGSRFGADRPKQFLELAGKPIIARTVLKFEASPVIDAIVVVSGAEFLDETKAILGRERLTKLRSVVSGGETRSESVAAGLAAVPAGTEIVAVHDGVRPLVSGDEIERTIRASAEYGAACLTAQMTDTVKVVDGAYVVGTLDRRELRRALTPQAFRYEVLKDAYDNADLGEAVTDECFLVEESGTKVLSVAGSQRNIKITTPDDLVIAEALFSASVDAG
ncbi:MAG TPA: 2-C-methyl-D-erythritol 4-phosphate cytidylyltransferase, partial [Pyrinomonadaceae bacterium]|nr:2-C-methyl-D-erythritol 4-phosphate cytidylyltransferase [Pyrinomonadaceae bacterium]